MSYSFRCLICDLAFDMGLSEDQFYSQFDMGERAQLVATYQSKLDRQTAMIVVSES